VRRRLHKGVWPRVSDAGDGSRYGDTEVWARLLAESSGGVWAKTRAGASVVVWGGRSDCGVEATVRRRGGRVIAKCKWVWVWGNTCGKWDGRGDVKWIRVRRRD
jgi:hypothetical protein